MEQSNTPQSRKDFIKSLLYWSIWVAISGSLISTLTGCEDQKEQKSLDDNFAPSNLPLQSKPIHLWYKKIVEDKDIDMINFPWNKRSMEARIARCLRWKPVTDAVEDRYHIPRWLLMAMMAQEWLWDPTMPNLPWWKHPYWDWWLGLIHIQAVNAHNFWLKTLPRYTNAMCDDKHAALVVAAIKNSSWDLPTLLEKDDRFHPVMAVDVAGRFFMDWKKKVWKWTDSRIHALKRYSWRPYWWKRWYWQHIIKYWWAINYITWDGFPKNLSKGIQTDINRATKAWGKIKSNLQTLQFMIDWEKATYNEYLAYFEESMQNFELEKYVALGDSIPTSQKEDISKLPETTQQDIKRPQTTRKNNLITQEFVNTRQHNSEGYSLYRYKVKQWDNALRISDAFDMRDNKRGNKFKNTGNLNIVNFKWEPVKKFIPWQVVYIKAKK